jgi:predicted nucleic acid-binding protein
MNYVIDTSVAFKWVVAETDSAKATALRDDFRKGIHSLLTADLFPTEIANSLLIAERRGRIKAGEWPLFFLDVMRSTPVIHAASLHLVRTYEIASLIHASIYDSLYIALAENKSCTLVTADDKLFRKAKTHFPFVIQLSGMP